MSATSANMVRNLSVSSVTSSPLVHRLSNLMMEQETKLSNLSDSAEASTIRRAREATHRVSSPSSEAVLQEKVWTKRRKRKAVKRQKQADSAKQRAENSTHVHLFGLSCTLMCRSQVEQAVMIRPSLPGWWSTERAPRRLQDERGLFKWTQDKRPFTSSAPHTPAAKKAKERATPPPTRTRPLDAGVASSNLPLNISSASGFAPLAQVDIIHFQQSMADALLVSTLKHYPPIRAKGVVTSFRGGCGHKK